MMLKVTYVPAKTEVKTVVVEQEKIVLELTIEQAKLIKVLIGRTTNGDRFGVVDLYKNLDSLRILHAPSNYLPCIDLNSVTL